MEQPQTFEEFWTLYVQAHLNKTNRTLHFIGTSTAFGLVGLGVLTRRLTPILMAPVVGYGLAWIGHFLVEGNIPATFGHPLWSFKGDMKMWRMILEGTMDAEVERVLAEQVKKASETIEPEPVINVVPDPTIN